MTDRDWAEEIAAIAALKADVPAEHRKITETSRRELLSVGVVPPAISVNPDRDVTASDAVVVARVVWPGRALIAPDNATGPCSEGCGRVVQFRPHVATARTACVWCATRLFEATGQIKRLP